MPASVSLIYFHRECFTPLITTKFRRALEPHINYLPDGPRRSALKPSGDLLVGFSGGLGSTVLLDLVHRIYIAKRRTENGSGGKAHPKTTRVWKNVRVCYVEICDAFPGVCLFCYIIVRALLISKQMRDRTAEIEAAVGRYEGFEFIPLRIQDAFDPCWWETASGGSSKSPPPWAVDLSNEGCPIFSNNAVATSSLKHRTVLVAVAVGVNTTRLTSRLPPIASYTDCYSRNHLHIHSPSSSVHCSRQRIFPSPSRHFVDIALYLSHLIYSSRWRFCYPARGTRRMGAFQRRTL